MNENKSLLHAIWMFIASEIHTLCPNKVLQRRIQTKKITASDSLTKSQVHPRSERVAFIDQDIGSGEIVIYLSLSLPLIPPRGRPIGPRRSIAGARDIA